MVGQHHGNAIQQEVTEGTQGIVMLAALLRDAATGADFLAQSRFLGLSISCEMESRHLDCYGDETLKDRVCVFLTFFNFVCFCEYS
jgi:hypothetical protein